VRTFFLFTFHRSKRGRPALITLEVTTLPPKMKHTPSSNEVQSKLKLFETKIHATSPKVSYRKNETANFVRSRTTLERPLLKLKSRFEKNQMSHSSRSQSSERSHHDVQQQRLSDSSSRLQSHTRSMPDVSIQRDLQWSKAATPVTVKHQPRRLVLYLLTCCFVTERFGSS